MDQDRLTASLRDEIGLAIENAMSVTPAPGLAAQVRARVDRERARSTRWTTWQLSAVAAVSLIIAGSVLSVLLWRREIPVAPPTIAAVHTTVAVPYVPAVRPTAPVSRFPPAPQRTLSARASAAPRLSPDAAALRNFVANIRNIRIEAAAPASAQSTVPPLEFPAIAIERIAIDPLPRLEAVLGERQ